jgi:hypothetical protein
MMLKKLSEGEGAQEVVAVERRKEETAQQSVDTCEYSARIFTHDDGRFAKCQKTRKGYEILLEMSFFFPKNIDGEGIWGCLAGSATRTASSSCQSAARIDSSYAW